MVRLRLERTLDILALRTQTNSTDTIVGDLVVYFNAARNPKTGKNRYCSKRWSQPKWIVGVLWSGLN
jgi:hypothetical protein